MASSAAARRWVVASARARITSAWVASGGSRDRRPRRPVTSCPFSQIGPIIRRCSAPGWPLRSSRSWGRAGSRAGAGRRRTPCGGAAGKHRGNHGDQQPGQGAPGCSSSLVQPRAAPAEAQVARRLVATIESIVLRNLVQHEAGRPSSAYQNRALVYAVRFSLRLSTAAHGRRRVMRSVSRPTRCAIASCAAEDRPAAPHARHATRAAAGHPTRADCSQEHVPPHTSHGAANAARSRSARTCRNPDDASRRNKAMPPP